MKQITIEKKDIILALKKYIENLIYKKEKQDRYTKFDTDNDFFIGTIGEIAFNKFLKEKGYKDNKDYYSSLLLKPEDFPQMFNKINNKHYDKCDFIINLFKNEKGENKNSLRIDIKTQKYVGNYTNDWQFAVNEKTINKDKNIDAFSFIFTKYGTFDVIRDIINKISIDELKNIIKNNQFDKLIKIDSFEVDLLGIINFDKFKVLAEVFNKDEVFRINSKNEELISYKVFETMYRINLRYLLDLEKIIIPNKIDFNLNMLEAYSKLNNKENKNFVEIINSKKETFLFPYDKIYLNSQYKNFEDFLIGIKALNKQIDNKTGLSK